MGKEIQSFQFIFTGQQYKLSSNIIKCTEFTYSLQLNLTWEMSRIMLRKMFT